VSFFLLEFSLAHSALAMRERSPRSMGPASHLSKISLPIFWPLWEE
jgi:hypothetical protein